MVTFRAEKTAPIFLPYVLCNLIGLFLTNYDTLQ